MNEYSSISIVSKSLMKKQKKILKRRINSVDRKQQVEQNEQLLEQDQQESQQFVPKSFSKFRERNQQKNKQKYLQKQKNNQKVSQPIPCTPQFNNNIINSQKIQVQQLYIQQPISIKMIINGASSTNNNNNSKYLNQSRSTKQPLTKSKKQILSLISASLENQKIPPYLKNILERKRVFKEYMENVMKDDGNKGNNQGNDKNKIEKENQNVESKSQNKLKQIKSIQIYEFSNIMNQQLKQYENDSGSDLEIL